MTVRRGPLMLVRRRRKNNATDTMFQWNHAAVVRGRTGRFLGLPGGGCGISIPAVSRCLLCRARDVSASTRSAAASSCHQICGKIRPTAGVRTCPREASDLRRLLPPLRRLLPHQHRLLPHQHRRWCLNSLCTGRGLGRLRFSSASSATTTSRQTWRRPS
jgi:hypothetical protein